MENTVAGFRGLVPSSDGGYPASPLASAQTCSTGRRPGWMGRDPYPGKRGAEVGKKRLGDVARREARAQADVQEADLRSGSCGGGES